MARSGNPALGLIVIAGAGAAMWYFIRPGQAQAATLPASGSNANAAPGPVVTSAAPAPGRSGSDPRGVRNNNPGNIKYNAANNWAGQIGSDGTFVKFSSPEAGLRALFILLRNYRSMYGVDTITKLAQRWAPSSENNPATYAANVAQFSGIAATAAIDLFNYQIALRIARGIIAAENGNSWNGIYPDSMMLAAWNGAY